MTLEQEFKKETGLDAYILNDLRGHIAIDAYVEWLEEQLTLTDVVRQSEQLCEHESFNSATETIDYCPKCGLYQPS